MSEFVGKPVKVSTDAEGARPLAFVCEGRIVAVREVLSEWQDWGFGGTHPAARSWRTRRHRNYFRLLGEDGKVYEIYLDRGGRARKWYLYRVLDGPDQ
ncbi:MAG: DUF6504 family protein [Firmicutes bacterium]|nr:DUF6504 family protein [Bacillota bacterium]